MKLSVFAMAIVGCCCSPVDDGSMDAWCDNNPCHPEPWALYPEGNTGPLVINVLDRLTAATGVPFTVHPNGVPVRFVLETIGENGKPTCGKAERYRLGGISGPVIGSAILLPTLVPRGCVATEAVLLHESIHVFAPNEAHAPTGLFAKQASGVEHLDELALSVLCTNVPCERFEPEAN